MTTSTIDPQPTLWDQSVITNRRPSISERFDAFHRANPWVLDRLVELTYHYRDMGQRPSIKALIEQVRAESAGEVKQTDAHVRIDNSLSSLYARRIMVEHPDLDGCFSIRKRTAA